jgi:hypothetical protein
MYLRRTSSPVTRFFPVSCCAVQRAGGDYSRSVFFVVSAPAQQAPRGNRPRPDKIFFAS